jgi:hypothetical protein
LRPRLGPTIIHTYRNRLGIAAAKISRLSYPEERAGRMRLAAPYPDYPDHGSRVSDFGRAPPQALP